MTSILLQKLKKVFSGSQEIAPPEVNRIYKRSNFLKLIELERYRVHRNNHQFSLLLFNVNQNGDRQRTIGELVTQISNRVRRIDQVGWYDNFHIGVLLPNTTAADAQLIARDICRNHDSSEAAFLFETLSYPQANQMH